MALFFWLGQLFVNGKYRKYLVSRLTTMPYVVRASNESLPFEKRTSDHLDTPKILPPKNENGVVGRFTRNRTSNRESAHRLLNSEAMSNQARIDDMTMQIKVRSHPDRARAASDPRPAARDLRDPPRGKNLATFRFFFASPPRRRRPPTT